MATIIKIVNKNINPDLLHEQLKVAGIEVQIDWGGFAKSSEEVFFTPVLERSVTEVRVENGVKTEVFFDPGELHILATAEELSAKQLEDLDIILADHQAEVKSTDQTRQDQDAADLDELRALYDAGKGVLSGELELMIRWILRRDRGDAI